MSTRLMASASLLLLLLLLLSDPFHTDAAKCDKDDKATLLQIKAALGSPAALSSWTSKTSCCTWSGIDCNATTGRVTGLTIFAQDISAPFPDAVARLSALQSLNLAYNRLFGPIPPSLGTLPALTFLRLDNNSLAGAIPATLTVFDLSLVGNLLTGPLPATFAHADFGDVDVSDNELTGDASFLFGGKKNLNALALSHNAFHFDLTHVELPEVMDILKIDHNRIYGSIPAEAARRKWLQLDVSYNELCGPIPQSKYVQKFPASNFEHNKCLCGAPLSPCK